MRAIPNRGCLHFRKGQRFEKHYRIRFLWKKKKLYNAVRKIITLADGRQIEIETGKLAKQADGSVVVKMGDTMLLGTVVAARTQNPTPISCPSR